MKLKEHFFNEMKPRIDSTIGLYWDRIDEGCVCGFSNYEFKNCELSEISSKQVVDIYEPAYVADFRATYGDAWFENQKIIIEGRKSEKKMIWTINGYISHDLQDLIFKLQDILQERWCCQCWSD